MTSRVNFGWKIYLVFYVFLAAGNMLAVMLPRQTVHVYYQILIHFDKAYVWPYYLNVASAAAACFTAVPLFLFVSGKRLFGALFWKIFFFVRLLLDIFGRGYEISFFKAFLATDPLLAGMAFGLSLTVLLPSYLALGIYAFRRKAF